MFACFELIYQYNNNTSQNNAGEYISEIEIEREILTENDSAKSYDDVTVLIEIEIDKKSKEKNHRGKTRLPTLEKY